MCVYAYLPQHALVMAGAEGGDDTHTLSVSVKPLPTHAALGRVAAVNGRRINVLAAPLTQRDLLRHTPPPPLPDRTLCRRRREKGVT